ncbi:MAG: ABC transporter ATP-binding protein, partial [Eggerthellaceae bacterium]|nr:ABC transporter ATP-binding protein [Eggerthellaceae bacterium]
LGWFTKERPGQMGNLLTRDLMMVMNLPSMFLRQYLHSFITPLVIGCIFFVLDWRLGVSFFITLPILFIAWRISAKVSGEGHAKESEAGAQLAGRFIEFTQAQPSLRAAQCMGLQYTPLAHALEADYQATRKTLATTSRPIFVQTVLVQVVFALVLVCAALLLTSTSAPNFGVAEFVFTGILAVRAVDALNLVGQQGMALRVSQNSIDMAHDVLNESALPEVSHHNRETPTRFDIEFDHVDFSYDGTIATLKDVSLIIPQGSLTALVGPSGSGKTTLTRLIARFWDVDAGHIYVGGCDVRDISTQDLMSNIAFVFQDVYLFDATIEENIRLGNPKATDEQVRHAANVARLDDVANRLEDGWKTPVGEGGKRLSGGERQRVSIARALIKDAPIVLFDEATAALDAENEAAIVQAMHELAKDRTVVVIAHRLSTIAEADQIVMLEDGCISHVGRHEELLASSPRYVSFWDSRNAAAGWRIVE